MSFHNNDLTIKHLHSTGRGNLKRPAECTSANILFMIMGSTFASCSYWEKLGKGTQYLPVFFLTTACETQATSIKTLTENIFKMNPHT